MFLPEDCIETTTTVEMVLPSFPSTLSVKRGRDNLRVISFMMYIPEGRAIPATLGALQSLEDYDGYDYGNSDNGRGKGGGGLGGSGGGRSLSPLLGTQPLLEMKSEYHCRNSLDHLRYILESFHIK